MLTLTAVAEVGHTGLVVSDGDRVLVVDPPLDIDAVAATVGPGTPIAAIIETGIPTWRISGARQLAERFDVPLFAPDRAIDAADPLQLDIPFFLFPGTTPHGVPETGTAVLTFDNDGTVWTGSLDCIPSGDAAAARRRIATRFPGLRARGSRFDGTLDDLAVLDPPPLDGLNAEAVALTNQGSADMYWADPRFVDAVEPHDVSYLEQRLESRWPPTVVDLRRAPDGWPAGIRVPPERLASSFTSLAGEKELMVIADDDATAARAAGFLRRLGLAGTGWVALTDGRIADPSVD